MNISKTIPKALRRLMHYVTPPIIKFAFLETKAKIRRPFVKRQIVQHTKLHLACGNNILSGWGNIDILRRSGVINWDLAKTLPADAGTIKFIYCEHFIEHLSLGEAQNLLREHF